MTCNVKDTFLVRVTTQPTETVLIYTVPASPAPGKPDTPSELVRGFSFSGTRTLCFKEDPASTISDFVIGVDKCLSSTCRKPAIWGTDKVLSVEVSVPIHGDAGELLLKATSGAKTYTAANNPPQTDGGRPIIRNPFGIFVVATLVAVAFVICYLVIKKLIKGR